MKEKIQAFMSNRRGMDELNKMLSRYAVCFVLAALILSLLHRLSRISSVMFILGWILLAAFLLRYLSRNISARDAENYAWLS